MATGTLPFRGDSSAIITDSILNRLPVAPVRLNPDVPPKLEDLINKALEKDRNLRYQTASEMRADRQQLKRDTDSRKSAVVTEAAPVAWNRRVLWVAGALMVICAAVVAGYFFFRRPAKLTEKDTVVLADFTNTTGDPVFDDTLKQALSVALRQSPFLNVISDDNVNSVLRMMARAPNAPSLRSLRARSASDQTAKSTSPDQSRVWAMNMSLG